MAWVLPMSSSTEPADLYIERHLLDKVPSDGKGHCALEPFVRLLGKSVKTIREELLAHTSTLRASKALSGLSEADWADLKRRLVPPGCIKGS